MKIKIEKFPGHLKNDPNHPLQRFSCDITNYLIGQGVCDDESNVPQLVGIEFDPESTKYCTLILELKDNHTWGPIRLVYLIDYVRALRKRTNIAIEMHVSPCDRINFLVQL